MLKALLMAGAMALACAMPASAGSLPAPDGPVILTVTGSIENTNADGAVQFDAAMLDALAGRSATMETPWTEGETEFEGPLLRAVLEKAGANGATLVVKALNDYSAEVPASDAADLDTILAVRMNGAPMSVRDKGPLFLIYPFDQNPEIYNEKYFSRSVWQIKEIEVRP